MMHAFALGEPPGLSRRSSARAASTCNKPGLSSETPPNRRKSRRGICMGVEYHIAEAKPIAIHALADFHRNRFFKHRSVITKRMKLAAFAAGIDSRREVGEEGLVKHPARELAVELFRIDARENRSQSAGQHRSGQNRRVGHRAPERKQRFETSPGQQPFAIRSNVLQEEIAESELRDAGANGAREEL